MWQLIKSIGANNANYLHTRTNILGKSLKTEFFYLPSNQWVSQSSQFMNVRVYHESNIVPVHPIIVVLMDGGLSCAQSCLLQTVMAVVRYDDMIQWSCWWTNVAEYLTYVWWGEHMSPLLLMIIQHNNRYVLILPFHFHLILSTSFKFSLRVW